MIIIHFFWNVVVNLCNLEKLSLFFHSIFLHVHLFVNKRKKWTYMFIDILLKKKDFLLFESPFKEFFLLSPLLFFYYLRTSCPTNSPGGYFSREEKGKGWEGKGNKSSVNQIWHIGIMNTWIQYKLSFYTKPLIIPFVHDNLHYNVNDELVQQKFFLFCLNV